MLKKTFCLQPEVAAAVDALPIAAECTTAHGTWHTLLVGTLLRALLAGDVRNLEQHYATTDAARDDAASRSASHAANVRHHGAPYALDAWPTSDEQTP